jgi:hypothetical protein
VRAHALRVENFAARSMGKEGHRSFSWLQSFRFFFPLPEANDDQYMEHNSTTFGDHCAAAG